MAVQAAIPLAGKLLPLLQGITANPAMAARLTGAAAGGGLTNARLVLRSVAVLVDGTMSRYYTGDLIMLSYFPIGSFKHL